VQGAIDGAAAAAAYAQAEAEAAVEEAADAEARRLKRAMREAAAARAAADAAAAVAAEVSVAAAERERLAAEVGALVEGVKASMQVRRSRQRCRWDGHAIAAAETTAAFLQAGDKRGALGLLKQSKAMQFEWAAAPFELVAAHEVEAPTALPLLASCEVLLRLIMHHPPDTRFTKIIGTSIFEATMRPNPRCCWRRRPSSRSGRRSTRRPHRTCSASPRSVAENILVDTICP
jgi:hypothetical protein